MTATELKSKYPIYPEILIEKHGEGFKANTLVRKNFNGINYLIPIIGKNQTEQGVREHTKQSAEIFLEHGTFIHPESVAAKSGFMPQYVEDDH